MAVVNLLCKKETKTPPLSLSDGSAEARQPSHSGTRLVATDFSEADQKRLWSMAEVRSENECWPWKNKLTPEGYGRFRLHGKRIFAHRMAVALTTEIPAGFTIDHVCRNKKCANPRHLEVVTKAENLRRKAAAITHCPQGHEYNSENTYISRGWRYCRICVKAKGRAYDANGRGKKERKRIT